MSQKLSDYNIGGQDAQMVLGVGDSGTGKSVGFASWPKPLYIACCDGRVGSVAEWHRGEAADQIEFDNFIEYDPLADKIEGFADRGCPYKTILLDPLTNLSTFLIKYSLAKKGVVSYDPETGTVSKGTKGKSVGRVALPTFDEYNTEYQGIESMLMNLRKIHKQGVNIILTAHLLTTTYHEIGGKEGNIRRDIVTAGKKIVPFIPTQFDEYYYFYCEGGSYKINTYNDGIVAARSSFSLMPKTIDWTNKDLYGLISQYYVKTETKEREN